MDFDITKNFNSIYASIMNQGIKRTAFAKAMGYSSTSQLSSTLEGEALISTKAVIELVKNFNVNPTFLFTGRGSMFLVEKEEIDELKEQIKFIEKQRDSSNEIAEKLAEMVKILEKRNGDLIDMTALALKNYKEEQETKKETT
jgi:transcriptional regulator with XRE-family HTH domain